MSIRLKKVEWRDNDTASTAIIMGDHYTAFNELAIWGNGIIAENLDSINAAKFACEQHALERIREAVEVEEPDHIPDATKMVNSWRDISTAPRDGTDVLVCTDYGHVYVASYIRGSLCDGDLRHIMDASHWMPLPKPPKEAHG